jgi:hypothetical protein
VWGMLSSWKRINLSYLLVFDSSSPRNYVKVARLLGRPHLELLEVESYSEFYWELPQVLPKMSCAAEYFRQDPELYYDWHRAMDQVESILRECLGKNFALAPDPSSRTWLQRAKDAERAKWAVATGCYHCGICQPMGSEEELEANDLVVENKVRVY